ncbi:MAG: penicillin-binding transpeptidase domain-containing protein [Chlamydiota bacterium]
MSQQQIPYKANRILNLFLIGLLLIMTRVWYLSVIQHDEKLKESRQPRRKSVVQQVERATIRDRFNIPLATNRIQYKAAVCYAQIREVPSVIWKKDEEGKSYRHFARSVYVARLAELLAKELKMSSQEIEDIIHGKASLFPHTPFIIKNNISEKEYYRLRMLERGWLGIQVQRSYQRIYPHGKMAGEIIGYMGAISRLEHQKIAREINELQDYISLRERGEVAFLPKGFATPLAVRRRLKELQEKAYTINDFVGKTGIEGTFDQQLRGFSGKKSYEVDIKGNFFRELPGTRHPVSGQRVILTISSELQEFSEKLLAYYEKKKGNQGPWIKGGAIVAMDPKTGEVLALASYPRIDPNDFTQKNQASILRFLEHESHIAAIWNGRCPMQREHYSFEKQEFYEESKELTWEGYLDSVLGIDSPVREVMGQVSNLFALLKLLEDAEHSLDLDLLKSIPFHEDKLLALDLCRLLVKKEDFSQELLFLVGNQSLSYFRSLSQIVHSIQDSVKEEVKQLYRDTAFASWRKEHFKEYLQQKRQIEKEKKRYARPFTEYLDMAFKQRFSEFWQEYRLSFVKTAILKDKYHESASYFSHLSESAKEKLEELKQILVHLGPLADVYLKTMRSFEDLDRPLLGKHRGLKQVKGISLEKHLASAFYPVTGYGFGRSQAYRQSTPQGSIFKLVTAYEALRQRYMDSSSFSLNPLTLIDDMKVGGKILGYTENGEVIGRVYKGGVLPRGHFNIGKVDLRGALEQSSNLYFSILASDCIESPENLADAARLFGFAEKTGIELPGEIAGNVPSDLSYNRTGLYAFAIGQHSLVVTPLQTALMLSAIANYGNLLRPRAVKVIAGKEPSENVLFAKENYSFQEDLSLVGINFPLFSEMEKNREEPKVSVTQLEAKRQIFFPEEVRSTLLEGMRLAVQGTRGTARPSILRDLYDEPQFLRDYIDLHKQIVGKTGTAEILYKGTIDSGTRANIHNHVWFGGVAFDQETSEPELVVVIYLRFGDAGKEAAPFAAQIVKKWRQIKLAHAGSD